MKPFQGVTNISNMPDNVVTNIMDRLRLKDAVRTGILSRNWRFKWTLLSQLVFDRKFLKCFKDAKDRTDVGRVISRILLHVRGVITKFVLSIDGACYSATLEEDISHWILFLSRKGIKDITLELRDGKPLKLSAHLFSCMELKHLKLVNCCCFDPPASFNGFPNLVSLDLHDVDIESRKFVKLFTRCPMMEILKLGQPCNILLFLETTGNVKLKVADIAKLANLKKLYLFVCLVDNTRSPGILELVGSLPNLQELHLNFKLHKITFTEMRFPTTFPCSLKTLNVSEIDLSNGIGLSYVLKMISSFPNLETLEITCSYRHVVPKPMVCFQQADYSTMGLLRLRSVVLTYLTASENEVCLIKYLLACSPFLKKMGIWLLNCVASDQKYMFATKLLKLHRASSEVDIDLH